jgi:hypothetical protein
VQPIDLMTHISGKVALYIRLKWDNSNECYKITAIMGTSTVLKIR